MEQKSTLSGKKAIAFLTLILAGEGIFLLPFVLARILRPTYLDVFGLTNLQLGAAYSVYGILAMMSYLPGGMLADRFSAKKLMMAALLTTALGGALLATMPPLNSIIILYGFWGVTTILLFWGALIRLTRAEVDAAFEKLAERLRKTEDALQIIGHTDDVGSEQHNLGLGMARAAYIHDILLAKGIPAARMCVESKGEGEPVADNASEEGKRQNRRVEILLENQGTLQDSDNLPRR